MSRKIQNSLIAFIMATSVTALFYQTNLSFMKVEIYHIPILFIVILLLSAFIAEDVRNSFKKVLWFEKREDKRPIWQVGVGMIFYFSQIGFVEVFARGLMQYDLGGMPMYIIIPFLNAFLLTVIFEEIFYKEEKNSVHVVKFKNKIK
ncbi:MULTISPECIES: DNA polymerase I [Solibacillus]|uniref:DNA polymerase I n=1 Tax=Solibacillus faecavium TaxID=2762221 RepID=A0ABR8XZT7_9BACL|nr:DNA polymerase I [Solibacillus faecavium]MBD8037476.1 DNA polymerase I [Solibacillus faecavium]